MLNKRKKYKLVILARSFAKSSRKPIEYLENNGFDVEIKRNHDINNEKKIAELIGEADAAIVGSDKIGSIVYNFCKNLRVVSKHGVGLDNIDLKGAKERNITVTITPGANHESVAELTWLLILSASRDLINVSDYVRRMDWKYPYLGNEVYNKTIGIIGYGRIGRAVVRRAVGYHCKILVYDPILEKIEPVSGIDIKKVTLKQLLQSSDIISVHAPLSDKSEKMIGEDAFREIKDGCILINTSRGELIDEDALYKALTNGKIKAAALDVFSNEPPIGNKLLKLKNVIATPHIGTHTEESNYRMGMLAAQNVVKVICDKNDLEVI
jgi:D-3-phosphoglycerate dehydrogenase